MNYSEEAVGKKKIISIYNSPYLELTCASQAMVAVGWCCPADRSCAAWAGWGRPLPAGLARRCGLGSVPRRGAGPQHESALRRRKGSSARRLRQRRPASPRTGSGTWRRRRAPGRPAAAPRRRRGGGWR